MRVLAIATILISVACGLAVSAPQDGDIQVPDTNYISLVDVYGKPNFEGKRVQIGNGQSMYEHPETDGSTAVCYNTPRNYVSSVVLTTFPWNGPFSGQHPSGCMLFSEEKCKGDSTWIQQSGFQDYVHNSDFSKFGWDKRTASLKCWFKNKW